MRGSGLWGSIPRGEPLTDAKCFLRRPVYQLPESLSMAAVSVPLLDLGVVLNSNLHSALVPSGLEQKGASFTSTMPSPS